MLNLIDVRSSKTTLEYLAHLSTISRMAENFSVQIQEAFKWSSEVEQEVSVQLFSMFRTFFASVIQENSKEYLTSLEIRKIIENSIDTSWHNLLQYMEKMGFSCVDIVTMCRVLNEILLSEVENGGFTKLNQFQPIAYLVSWMTEKCVYHLAGRGRKRDELISIGTMDFRGLSSIVESVRSPVDLQPFFQIIVDRARSSQLWPMCAIGIVDRNNQEIRVPAQSGFTDDYPKNIKFSATGSATLEAIRRNQTIAIDDVLQDTEFPVLKEAARAAGYQSIILVPIFVDDIRAVVTFGAPDPHDFTKEEILLAEAIAQLVMTAIENAQQYEKEKQRVEQLESLNHLIAEQNQTLKRAREIHTALTELALGNAGIDGILHALRRLLGNPTAIEDNNYQLLYYSDDSELDDKHRHVSIATGGTAVEVLHNARIATILDELKKTRKAVIIPVMSSVGIEKRRLVAPIIAGGDILGYVWVMEALHPFDEQDFITLEQAALVIALEMVKQRATFETELRIKADLFDDLLLEKEVNPAVLLQKSNYLGYNINQPSFLLVVDIDNVLSTKVEDKTDRHRHIMSIQRAVSGYSNENIVAYQAGQIAVVLPAPENNPDLDKYIYSVASNIRQAVILSITPINILIGISDICFHITDIRQQYLQARKVIEIAKRLKRKNETLRLRDLGIYGILYNENNQDGLQEFAKSCLEPLVSYDQLHKTELVKSLQVYLENQGKLSDTARYLYIHVNTLRQRLDRIEELLKVNLQDHTACLNLHLALQIYQFV